MAGDRMDSFHIELSGELSPFLCSCIGVAIVALALTPTLYIILRYA